MAAWLIGDPGYENGFKNFVVDFQFRARAAVIVAADADVVEGVGDIVRARVEDIVVDIVVVRHAIGENAEIVGSCESRVPDASAKRTVVLLRASLRLVGRLVVGLQVVVEVESSLSPSGVRRVAVTPVVMTPV